ncbi:MAG: pantoate--beta-alanine ligase [Gammaproteobacteria bacterium]|nr:pantoate--beta-alanine ligase [Gammaproteobacteria bacterium]
MEVIETIKELRQTLKSSQQRINFVPTMGNLHQGHLDLVNYAKSLEGQTVVSIFVNPLQFDQKNDLDAYPRTIEEDKQKLIECGCDVLFLPGVDEVYPGGTAERLSQTIVSVAKLSSRWEGESRPGHFDGMATIVVKLFQMVQPDVAIFGQKDYQQLQIIRQFVKDLCMPIEIVQQPITRERDGLAMSSRNSRLNSYFREIAPILYQQLQIITEGLDWPIYNQRRQQAEQFLTEKGFNVEYLALADQQSLEPVIGRVENTVLLAAVKLGGVRLIDNIVL